MPSKFATRIPRRSIAGLIWDRKGAAAVEFAAVLPVMAALWLGFISVSLIINNYVTLGAATAAAARQFAMDAPVYNGALTTSLTSTPYSDVQSQLLANAFLLKSFNSNTSLASTAGVTIASLCIYPLGSTCASGTTCNSDSTCTTALSTAQNSEVSLSTSYPCFVALPVLGLTGCSLNSTSTFVVQ